VVLWGEQAEPAPVSLQHAPDVVLRLNRRHQELLHRGAQRVYARYLGRLLLLGFFLFLIAFLLLLLFLSLLLVFIIELKNILLLIF
jgi:hypothetical protein